MHDWAREQEKALSCDDSSNLDYIKLIKCQMSSKCRRKIQGSTRRLSEKSNTGLLLIGYLRRSLFAHLTIGACHIVFLSENGHCRAKGRLVADRHQPKSHSALGGGRDEAGEEDLDDSRADGPAIHLPRGVVQRPQRAAIHWRASATRARAR